MHLSQSYDGRFTPDRQPEAKDAGVNRTVPPLSPELAALLASRQGVRGAAGNILDGSDHTDSQSEYQMDPERRMNLLHRSSLRWVATALMDLCDEKGITPIELTQIWSNGQSGKSGYEDLLIETTARVAELRSQKENGTAVLNLSPDVSRRMVLDVVDDALAPLAALVDSWKRGNAA